MASQVQALTVNQIKKLSAKEQDYYLMGLLDGLAVMGVSCGGGGGETYGQMEAVVQKYIANHPEDWAYEVSYSFLTAIMEAFHCKTLGKQPKTEVKWLINPYFLFTKYI